MKTRAVIRGTRNIALPALLALLAVAGLVPGCGGGGGGGGSNKAQDLSIGEAVARDGDGVAQRLGEKVRVEGVATVSAGIFANNKLKIFLQDGGDGIMVYHQNSAEVPAFQSGDQLQATGIIRQADPTSDNNLAIGTVLVDTTDDAISLVGVGKNLPNAHTLKLSELVAHGDQYVGTIVRVQNVSKVAGDWPTLGSKSTQVTISDDGGTTQVILRFQRNTITQQMVSELDAIGNSPYELTGIVVQDDNTNDGKLFDGYEIWVRGSQDINGAP